MRYSGAYGKANVGISNDKGGENGKANVGISNDKGGEKPPRRKTKVS